MKCLNEFIILHGHADEITINLCENCGHFQFDLRKKSIFIRSRINKLMRREQHSFTFILELIWKKIIKLDDKHTRFDNCVRYLNLLLVNIIHSIKFIAQYTVYDSKMYCFIQSFDIHNFIAHFFILVKCQMFVYSTHITFTYEFLTVNKT